MFDLCKVRHKTFAVHESLNDVIQQGSGSQGPEAEGVEYVNSFMAQKCAVVR